MPDDITIYSNERVFICGKTGTGKTTLARYLLRQMSRLVVIDSKGSLSDWDLDPWDDRQTRIDLERGDPARLRVLPPLHDDPDPFYAEVFATSLQARNLVVYVDELYAVVPPGARPAPEMAALWTRGREYGIGAWAATQRPVWVPLFALSEAEHIFMFRLNVFDDRKRLAAFTSEDVLTRVADPHGFFYQQSDWDEPVYVPQLKISPNGSGRKEKS